jgi:GAF domain-containing protein
MTAGIPLPPDSLRELQSSLDRSPVDALVPRLRMVVAAANDLLSADGVGVLLLDDGNQVRTVAATDSATEALEQVQEHLSVGPGIDALRSRRTVAVSDLAEHDTYGPLWQRLASDGVRAVLSAPIWVSGDVVGNLNAVRTMPHTWTPTQVAGSEAFAGVIGRLLELSAASTRHLPGGRSDTPDRGSLASMDGSGEE